MWKYINHAHSGFRWIVLFLLIFSIINAFKGWKGKKNYTVKDKKLHLFTMISVHIQVLIGFVSFYLNWGGKVNFSTMGESSTIRFFTVEHSSMMLMALILITIGFSKSKKIIETPLKFKKIFITYLIGLIIILGAIPWPVPIRNLGVTGWF
jgi:hypothetical protein